MGQKWTLNTRAWSTNYFTTLIYNVVQGSTLFFITDGGVPSDSLVSAILPNADLVFPVGLQKEGFDNRDIYGAYRAAFKNPFKYIGDFAVGIDASWKPTVIGLYAGAFFKSQEVRFKDPEENLRGFYFQPRGGILLGGRKGSFECGVFYDMVIAAGGTIDNVDKDRLLSGLGLDFAVTLNMSKHHKSSLQYSMPLHNFFNEAYAGQAGMKRRVGYVMITHRFAL